MVLKLYSMKAAAPSRSVLLTAAALGLPLDIVPINLTTREQTKPEFVKLNPQHTIPTLDDDGKIIWDSHAINVYLVTKYGKDDSLYPNDPYKRAMVNQRLHFDTGVLFSTGLKIIMPILEGRSKTVPDDLRAELVEVYGFLEKFLDGKKWITSDQVTIADFNLLASTTNIDVLVPVDPVKFPNITAWLKRAETLPNYHVNEDGLNQYKAIVQKQLNS